jgi:hypothetical protein
MRRYLYCSGLRPEPQVQEPHDGTVLTLEGFRQGFLREISFRPRPSSSPRFGQREAHPFSDQAADDWAIFLIVTCDSLMPRFPRSALILYGLRPSACSWLMRRKAFCCSGTGTSLRSAL